MGEYESVEEQRAMERANYRDQWVADVQNAGTELGLDVWVVSRNRLKHLQQALAHAAGGRAWNRTDDRYVPDLMDLIVAKASSNGDKQVESMLSEAKRLLDSAHAIVEQLYEVCTRHVSGLP